MEPRNGVPEAFLKPYDPVASETPVYEMWEKSGYFNPDNLPGERSEPYTIIMPPPNANGSLHVGHALFVTLQDVLIRYKRMRGYRTLWLPGADHAGFETQLVFEKRLEKEGRSRFKMPRDEFYKETLAFTLDNKQFMEGQLRQLGASCDWSRNTFTLDPKVVKIVYETFKKLYDDGLVIRGSRPVHWSTKYQTSLSDLETRTVERQDPFYYFQYGPFVIGTVRPETKFGDKHVVVHPDDERYKQYTHGDTFEAEWINGKITATLIKDESIDMSFGTGAMTITPAHDATDFAIAQRHNLPIEEVIDQFGRLNDKCGKYAGMKILEARAAIAQDLEAKGLVVKVEENYKHNVLVNYKSEHDILEPRVMPQWFVKMKPLADIARKAVEDGRITFVSDQYRKIFFHWLDELRDWNISRQIVWGIPIPAWFKGDEIKIQDESPGDGWVRDPDTFDTWFSSGQWPFATLGYPDSPDFKTFYPTSVMETGYDILFFWVMRMIMLGLYRTGEVPFKDVYLHGLVRDANRQKMSKSKGNVINPLAMTEVYGTDALRMALLVGNTPGQDMALAEPKIKAYKLFSNKLWNIARFVLESVEELDLNAPLTDADKAHLEEARTIAADVTADMENYRLYIAAEKLYHYLWDRFAAEIIEESKPIFKGDDAAAKASRARVLYEILTLSLKLLHPFMPFVTEAIWQKLPQKDGELLMIAAWPQK